MTIPDKWKPIFYALLGVGVCVVLAGVVFVGVHLYRDHVRSDQMLELVNQQMRTRQQKPPEAK